MNKILSIVGISLGIIITIAVLYFVSELTGGWSSGRI